MPFRRTYRRRSNRRRRWRPRMYRKNTMRFRVPRNRSLISGPRKPHSFKRTFEGSNLVINTSTLAGAITFNLAQLPGYTEFTSLFDQYRLNGIKFRILPQFNSVQLLPSDNISVGRIYSALDYTDATAPTSLNAILEYQNMKSSPIWRGHKRYFRPAVPMITNTPATIQLTESRYSPWIATVNPTVPHYAIKFWVDGNSGLTSNNNLKVQVSFYFQCKNVI